MAEFRIMDTMTLLPCILLSVFLSASYGAKPELTIIPGGNLRQGDNLTITCETNNFERFDFIRIERVGDGGSAYRGEIVTNDVLNDAHKASGRYTLLDYALDENTGVARIKIRIENIQGRDGGRLECAHQPKGQTASEEISIAVPPKEVTLMYLDEAGVKVPVTNGGVLKMKHGRDSGIYCHVEVEGQTTAPKIDLLMDNKDAKAKFKKDHYTDTGVAETGFLNDRYVADFQYVSAEPDVSFNDRKLLCRAKLGNFPPVESQAKIEIIYAPQLNCEVKWFAKLGAKDVKITCKGKMNPLPSVVTWAFGKRPNRTVLEDGQESDGISAKMTKVGRDEYEFALTIDEFTQDRIQKYKLTVANDIGQAENSIGLHEEEATTANPTKISDGDKNSGGEVWDKVQASSGSALRMLFSTLCLLAIAISFSLT